MTIPQTETALPKFITVAELVAAAKFSRQTASRKLKTGEIPHVKVGTRILIPASFLMSLESAAWAAMKQGGCDA